MLFIASVSVEKQSLATIMAMSNLCYPKILQRCLTTFFYGLFMMILACIIGILVELLSMQMSRKIFVKSKKCYLFRTSDGKLAISVDRKLL